MPMLLDVPSAGLDVPNAGLDVPSAGLDVPSAGLASTERLTYRMARSASDRDDAFRLVYRSYLKSGLGTVNPYGMRVTRYQLCETSQTFVGLEGSEVVTTVTLVGDGHLGLPMDGMFSAEVNALRSAGKRVAEVSCLADRRSSHSRFLESFCQLNRMMAQFARYQGIECLLVTVHPRHARFYRRYFGFKPISSRIADCPHVQGSPAAALILDFDEYDKECPESWHRVFGSWIEPYESAPYQIPDDERCRLTEIAEHCEAGAAIARSA